MQFRKSILALALCALIFSSTACRQENGTMGPFEGVNEDAELDAAFGGGSLISQKGDAEGIYGGDSILASHFELYPEDRCNGKSSYRRALARTNNGIFAADKVCGEDISLAFRPTEEVTKIYGYASHLALYKDRIYEAARVFPAVNPDEEDEVSPFYNRYLKHWCVNNELTAIGTLGSEGRSTLSGFNPTYGISVEIRKSETEFFASFQYSEATQFADIGISTSSLQIRQVPPLVVTQKKLTDGDAYYAPGFVLKIKPASTTLKVSVDGVIAEFPIECKSRP